MESKRFGAYAGRAGDRYGGYGQLVQDGSVVESLKKSCEVGTASSFKERWYLLPGRS
jgi:hypothetical protein